MADGPKLVRAGICEDHDPDALELHVPRLFCPACQLWPAARELASAGEELFPGWAGQKVLSELRRFANLKAWRGANRLGAHPLRRGAARATLEAGGSFPQLLRPGQLHSSAHQLYLDLEMKSPVLWLRLWSRRRRTHGIRGRYPISKSPRYEDPKDCRPLA